MKALGGASLCVLASLAARSALAADCPPAGAAEQPCAPVEVVVTGTRTKESSQRSTVRTDYVTREEAERRGATNVAEALAAETTLQVNPEGYGYLGRPSGAQIQGMDADRVLVLEDGERVIGDRDGVVDLAELPLVDVERIEYVAGPTSSLYGTNALGGVINVISAPPASLGASARYRLEGRASGEALGSLSGSYRSGDHWLTLDAALHHRPGIEREPDKPDLLVPVWLSSTLGLRAGTRPTRGVELKLRARWVRDESDGLSSQQVPGLGTYVSDLPQVTQRLLVRAQETLELASGTRVDFSLTRSWYFDDTRRDRRDSPLDELRVRKLEHQALETIVTVPDGRSRTWVFGLRSEAERFSQRLERTLPSLETERIEEIAPTLLSTAALYGQLGWKLTARTTLMPGLRGEVTDRYGLVAAPRLALAHKLTPELAARVALGRGFRAPSAKEFGFEFDHSALGYRILGNRNLRPESSWGLTGDVTYARPRFRARVGGFVNEIDDLITVDFAPTSQIAGVTDYVYENVERARTAGGDISLRYQVVAPLSFEAGYAFLWTRALDSNEELTNRPPHTLTFAGLLTLGKLGGSLRYRWVSSAFAGRIDDEARASPAFGLLDARLSYSFAAPLAVFVGSLNILDAKRRALATTDTRPARGREFYLGLSGELPGD